MNNTKDKPVYKLLKDLPDVKAGAIFEMGQALDAYYLTSDKTGTKYNCYCYPTEFVENANDWFQLQQPTEEQPKRIEVTNLRSEKIYADPRCTDSVMHFDTNIRVPEKKYEAVKKAIETVLNGGVEVCIPSDAKDIEVFHIRENEAYIGFKISNGNFHFIQVQYNPRKNPQSVEDKEKVDWEIKGYEFDNRIYIPNAEPYIYLSENFKSKEYKIHSVLRKSDNALIVLHKTKVVDPNTKHAWVVSEIYLKEDKIYLNGVWLNHVEIISETKITPNKDSISCTNTEEKKPLFTTEEGFDVMEGEQTLFYVSQFKIRERKAKNMIHIQNKRFCRRDAAEKYITLNKPSITFNEVMICYRHYGSTPDFQKYLTELVNQKIKQ